MEVEINPLAHSRLLEPSPFKDMVNVSHMEEGWGGGGGVGGVQKGGGTEMKS